MDRFMERAVQLAINNVKEGGQPFGAVLVKEQEVVSEGVNELHKKHDISGHAELLAIRRAQEKMQTNDLSGFIMYASGEPCPMCLTAMYFAGIEKVFYCQAVEDAAQAGLGKSQFIYDELKKLPEDRVLNMNRVPLKAGQDSPMQLWKQKNEL